MSWLWAIPIGIGALVGMVMFFEKRGAMKNRLGSAMSALKVHARINKTRKDIYAKVRAKLDKIDPDNPDLFK